MNNPHVYIDVQQTVIDANGQLFDGVAEALGRLKTAGFRLYLWSSEGGYYAWETAEKHGLVYLFDGFLGKPDIIVDDMPHSVTTPHNYRLQDAGSWDALVNGIIKQHIEH